MIKRVITNWRTITVLTIVLLAFGLGASVFGKIPPLTAEQRERARISNAEYQARLEYTRPIVIAWEIGWRALLLGAGAGLLTIALRAIKNRADQIRPNSAGIFPMIRVKTGGVLAIHDPNKSATPITLFAPEQLAQRIAIVSVPSTDLATQERTTARAQAVQLTAAAHQHPSLPPGSTSPKAPAAASPAELEAGAPEALWPARVPLGPLLRLQGGSDLSRLIIGQTVDPSTGQPTNVTGDMAKLIHVAVGGSAGWGKSVFLQSLVYQLATCPQRPSLALVDLDGTTLSPFADSERLRYPIADNPTDALAIFQDLAGELEERKAQFARVPGAYSLTTYNAHAAQPLPPIILICDEATALLDDHDVEKAVKSLALRGRKFGLWSVLAGQDWKASSLDSAIKNQLSTTVQFKARSPAQSRALLGQRGAEELTVPGRALTILPGRDLTKIQAPHITYDDITTALRGQAGPQRSTPPLAEQEQKERIRQLHADGLSLRAIQRELFGYTGGAAYEAVSQAIGEEK